jgi:hypothetical protein
MNREPHPDDPRLRATYKDQWVDCLAGVEISILDRMVDPKEGLVSKLVHPPSIGEVNAWVEKARAPMMTRIGWQIDEVKRIEQSDDKVISAEERERVAEGFEKLTKHLKSVGDNMRRLGAKAVGLKVEQVRDDEALLASLRELEKGRHGG